MMNRRNQILLVLTIIGVLISGYLSITKLLGTSTVCLGGSGSCELVQNSAYAKLLGIPVAYLGLLTYLGLMVLLLIKWSNWRDLELPAAQLFLGLAIIGALFSAYLTYIELFVIFDICQWCVASATVNWLLLLQTMWGYNQEVEMLS